MNLNYDFFKIDNSKYHLKEGLILISEPFLHDTYFHRSIVLITEHNEQGTIGFVLNKPSDFNAGDIIEGLENFNPQVSIGGPVGNNLVHFIHTLGDVLIPGSKEVTDGIFWGGDFELVKELIQTRQINENQIRLFIGYSGWSPKQLEKEISDNYWVISETDMQSIMLKNYESFWQELLSRMGDKYKIWTNVPDNPRLN